MFVSGCGQNIRHAYYRDGVLRSSTEGHIGFTDSEVTTHVNSQEYPVCQASIGSMPDGEEKELCRQEALDNARHRRETRDWQAAPYQYSPYYYVPYP
jgi:hypothetical protein